jgi:hypothetical protein
MTWVKHIIVIAVIVTILLKAQSQNWVSYGNLTS